MRVPLSWLEEFVAVEASLKELERILTMAGLEVEAMEKIGGEPVFDLAITPNRGDCLSILGVAREVAAATEQRLLGRKPAIKESERKCADLIAVAVEDTANCPRYSARVVTGVKVGPSPAHIQKRLEQCGIRPINNVVDVTNYVMLELGQPLHAFDRARLAGARIVARQATAGEKMVTLDGVTRELKPGMLLICDERAPVAIAGVMGGLASQVTPGTTEVVIESAHFNWQSVRRTSKALDLTSESSYRFERVVDPEGTVRAADRAAELLAECAGGSIAAGVVDVNHADLRPRAITLRPEKVNALLGVNLGDEAIVDLLERLGLTVHENESIVVQAPPRRPDLNIEEDLIEEVARVYGYDRVPSEPPPMPLRPATQPPLVLLGDRLAPLLRGLGLTETMSYSLTDAAEFEHLGFPEDFPLRRDAVRIRNPKSEEATHLRPSLLGGLLDALATNARRGVGDVWVYEIGPVFLPRPPHQPPPECRTLGLALMGAGWDGDWNLPDAVREADFFTLKGLLDTLALEVAGERITTPPASHPSFHAGRCAQMNIGRATVGIFGEIAVAVAAHYDLPKPAFLAEVDLHALLALARPAGAVLPPPRFPAVMRDLALVLDAGTPVAQVESVLRGEGAEFLTALRLFDVYAGNQIEAGKKSLAFHLEFRAADRTLTDAEVDERVTKIIAALEQRLGAQRRT